MIHGVTIKSLAIHPDDRGNFREILRSDEGLLKNFGQASITTTFPGVIKAFHWHARQDDLWYAVSGSIQAVLYDRRPDSPTFRETQVIYAGDTNSVLIVIPKGVAHGYRVLGQQPATLMYVTTEPYDAANPDEQRISFDDAEIGFNWTTQNR